MFFSMPECKINNCQGYFPEFIFLSNSIFNEIYNSQNAPKYYPYIHNGKFLRQLSNSRSKYNNNYFYNIRTAHNISKKFRGNPHASSRIGTLDSRTGTMNRCGDNKTHKTLKTHKTQTSKNSQ